MMMNEENRIDTSRFDMEADATVVSDYVPYLRVAQTYDADTLDGLGWSFIIEIYSSTGNYDLFSGGQFSTYQNAVEDGTKAIELLGFMAGDEYVVVPIWYWDKEKEDWYSGHVRYDGYDTFVMSDEEVEEYNQRMSEDRK